MNLVSLANEFLVLSRQLNLLVRPTLKTVSPIPKSILPRLLQLSLGEGSGSPMEYAISLVEENNKRSDHFTAVLAYIDNNIVGWALIKLDPEDPSPSRRGDIDIFVDPKFRRHDIGAQLKHEAKRYIESKNHVPDQYDHFQPYREENLPEDLIRKQQIERTHQLLRSLHSKRKLVKNKKELAKINEEIRQLEFTMKDMLEDERTPAPHNPNQLTLL